MKGPIRVVILLILVIILAGAGYYLLTLDDTTTPAANQSRVTEEILNPPTTEEKDKLLAGGSSFSDPQGVFSFLYPSEYTLDQQNNGVITRVYKLGPSQRGQTEMYDGVNITIESITLQNQSLSQYVDDYIEKATADGTSEVVKEKAPFTMNTYPGFTFTLRGLGEYPYYVIQKDLNSPHAIMITALVQDPTNVGFQKEVDAVFSTINLLK